MLEARTKLIKDGLSENHILEDVNKCVLALQEGDADTLDRTAGAIRGRSSRVCNVVVAEMDNYDPGIYTERVLEAVKVLRDQGNSLCENLRHRDQRLHNQSVQFLGTTCPVKRCSV